MFVIMSREYAVQRIIQDIKSSDSRVQITGFVKDIVDNDHIILKDKSDGIKIDIKKDLIQRKAKIDLIVVDIKAQMWEDKINTKAINKLIDQKYELKKAKAKSLLQAYVSLKKILTDEQKERLKELFKACKKKKAKH